MGREVEGSRSGWGTQPEVRPHDGQRLGLTGLSGQDLTQQHSRAAPAQGVVEAHGTTIHIPRLDLHSVEVEALHQEPGKGAEEEVVQEDGDCSTQQLRQGRETGSGSPAHATWDPAQTPALHRCP